MFSSPFPQPMAHTHEGFLALRQALRIAQPCLVLQDLHFKEKNRKILRKHRCQFQAAVPDHFLPTPVITQKPGRLFILKCKVGTFTGLNYSDISGIHFDI